MNTKYLISLVFSAFSLVSFGQLAEPASSVMAEGNWVKIRIDADGIYEMSYDELRDLGFSDPQRVRIFGYQPNVLLTHDLSQMPVDLSPLATINSEENQKIIFYGKGDTNFAPEFWTTPGASWNLHNKHAYGIGATYFLSDSDAPNATVASVAAPNISDIVDEDLLNTHTSLIYHETDSINLANGGVWFGGPAINARRPTERHSFTISKVAPGGNGRLLSRSLLSPTASQSYVNTLEAEFSDGIVAASSTGTTASTLSEAHDFFSQSYRTQTLTFPEESSPKTYSVDFSINANAATMNGDCSLDYFGILYERNNDVSGEAQMKMFFENWNSDALFSLSGLTDRWVVWDVTDPNHISGISMASYGAATRVGSLSKAKEKYPNEIIAFNPDGGLMKPVVLGKVNNQNLHSMTTPDMVILTSAKMTAAGEYAADFHRKHQGLDVEVVDQELIFNEYGSGNTSPEAIRRFLRHLNQKNPGRLRALLIIGPASFNNAHRVNSESEYVVIAECEDYEYCRNNTKNFATDAFYGRLGGFNSSNSTWTSRTAQLRILGGNMDISVGRLPYMSMSDIVNYYKKAEDYITNPPMYPLIGNILLGSDFCEKNEEPHFSNAEAVANVLGSKAHGEITVHRAASNLYARENNTIVKRVMNNALEEGSQLFVYMGHGSATTIYSKDFPITATIASTMSSPGRYPIYYFGSCSIAPLDINNSSSAYNLVSNPNGGAIAMIAAGREVYQAMNEALGVAFARELMAADDGEWIGDLWMRAHTKSVQTSGLSKKNIVNHLAYNLFGDPALPVYRPTNSVEVTRINDNGQLNSSVANVIEGNILDLDGDIDEDFDGQVIATLYDVEKTMNNKAGAKTATGTHSKYIESVRSDNDKIGEYVGSVKAGKFTVNFIAPNSSTEGTHRVRLYAVTSDGTRRGLGYKSEVELNLTADVAEVPSAGEPSISNLIAGTGAVDERNQPQVEISAVVKVPAGLGSDNMLEKPVRLVVDGKSYTSASRLLTATEPGVYMLNFVTTELAAGNHYATLAVRDAAGVWTEASLQFAVELSVSASIHVDKETDGTEKIILESAMSSSSDRTLMIERINGDVVERVENAEFPYQLALPAGAYRAYVQLSSAGSVTSTPKIDLIVD